MARGDIQQSPWIWPGPPGSQGADPQITITINFNNNTRNIQNGNIVRDPGCLWQRIVWDTPSSPNAKRSPDIPFGTTNFTAQQIQSFSGFTTIEQVLAVQITAEQ